jgi:hypothetical protein
MDGTSSGERFCSVDFGPSFSEPRFDLWMGLVSDFCSIFLGSSFWKPHFEGLVQGSDFV